MAALVDRVLSGSDREEIRRAVAEAERHSSAEIVVCVVARSDDYVEARWRAGVWFALAAALVPMLVPQLAMLWGLDQRTTDPSHFDVFWDVPWLRLALPIFIAGAGGALLASRIPWLCRRFVPEFDRSARVLQRAEQIFLAEEVFATRQRTGLLLFVSLFERIVCVVPDRAVRERVPGSDWGTVTDGVAAGIENGRLGESLRRGVGECGRLLATHGLIRGDGDDNELDDGVRGG